MKAKVVIFKAAGQNIILAPLEGDVPSPAKNSITAFTEKCGCQAEGIQSV